MNASAGPGPDVLGRRPAWRIINITPAERLGRIATGLAAIIAGAVLLASAGGALAVVLELLLVAAGLDLAVTGRSVIARCTQSSATCRSPCGGPDENDTA